MVLAHTTSDNKSRESLIDQESSDLLTRVDENSAMQLRGQSNHHMVSQSPPQASYNGQVMASREGQEDAVDGNTNAENIEDSGQSFNLRLLREAEEIIERIGSGQRDEVGGKQMQMKKSKTMTN